MALTASAEAQQGTKRTVIMILVILLHVLALWALQNGLARRLVDILPSDIKTKIIEEQKKEEPPPPPPPPPDMQTPPPPFVPPPEVTIATPMTPPPTAIHATQEKPPVTVPPVMSPPIKKAGFDPRHPPRSSEDFYPPASIRAGEEGVTVVEIYVAANGHVTDARIKTSSGFDRLDEAALKYVKTWRMLPQTRGGVAEGAWVSVPIRWKIVNR